MMRERPDIELIAARHHDRAALPAWAVGQVTPLDELMAKEEEGTAAEPVSFSRMFRLVLVFCFSDAQSGGWELPVWRALAVMRDFFAGDMVRARIRPVETFCQPVFSLSKVAEMLEEEPCAEMYLRRVMRYLLPFKGAGWEREAGKRLFLLAKAFLPQLASSEELSRDKVRWVVHELSYEQLAVVFGEMPADAGKAERGRARARWHAAVKREIVRPVEAAGEEIHLHFSKSAATREKYRQAQMGNTNRRGQKA
jgi:hypothetical protein